MELRTTFKIPDPGFRISYSDPVIFIGSCFATSIGKKFEAGKMPVMINPSGTVFNPVSVCHTLDTITRQDQYDPDNLFCHEGLWVSFDHYTDFSSTDKGEILASINKSSDEARKFISGARYLFITFGTARVYRWNLTGKIVSNCHKIPASSFTQELLSSDEIVALWTGQLDRLKSIFPDLQVIFTISPVRHWKDGAHGNQVSKSVLFLAVEQLLKHPSNPTYFPAYELVMDDLRDYRFYDEDMLHISSRAVDYIWEAFCRCYFDDLTFNLWLEVAKITKALSHRIKTGNSGQIKKFAQNMISRIDAITDKNPDLNLENEKEYFLRLIKDQADA